MRSIAALALLALTGCASQQQIAANDDATCQSYGAVPGSNAYIQCRMQRDGIRQQGAEARRTAILSEPMVPLTPYQMK